MIRLIATDMDGTLLRKDGTIHSGLFPLVYRLAEQGIFFVVASGRPISNLHRIFNGICKEIGLVAFNGAWCEWKGKIYSSAPVPFPVCRDAVLEARKTESK